MSCCVLEKFKTNENVPQLQDLKQSHFIHYTPMYRSIHKQHLFC